VHFTRFSIFTPDLEETELRTGPQISQTSPQDANLDCNWVSGSMAGGGSSIPARGRLDSAEKGRGSGVGSPRFHSVGCWRRRTCWRGDSAALGSDGRWNGCLGEHPAWERNGAAWLAPTGARGGVEVFRCRWNQAEEGVRRRRMSRWPRRTTPLLCSCRNKLRHARGQANNGFYSRATSCLRDEGRPGVNAAVRRPGIGMHARQGTRMDWQGKRRAVGRRVRAQHVARPRVRHTDQRSQARLDARVRWRTARRSWARSGAWPQRRGATCVCSVRFSPS
jgi:hypothetical protein